MSKNQMILLLLNSWELNDYFNQSATFTFLVKPSIMHYIRPLDSRIS